MAELGTGNGLTLDQGELTALAGAYAKIIVLGPEAAAGLLSSIDKFAADGNPGWNLARDAVLRAVQS